MMDRTGLELRQYRLIRRIGRGGFADVYLGEHLRLGTQAAIKVLHAQLEDEAVNRFLNEARIVASLDHPHIIRIFDFDVQDSVPFLVMDLAPNGTLRQRHPKGKQVPLPLIRTYVRQLASALQYAHDQKLIHRDLKPENMLLGKRNEVLLSDFGIAMIAQNSMVQSLQQVEGTIAYMAPEQYQGRPRPASDQYALGIIIYEWLTGERPFQGTFTELARYHLFETPLPLQAHLPAIPPALNEVVMTALAKEPKQRFASIQAFANAFDQVIAGNLPLSQSSTFLSAPSSNQPSTYSTSPAQHPSQDLAAQSLNIYTPSQDSLLPVMQNPVTPPPPIPPINPVTPLPPTFLLQNANMTDPTQIMPPSENAATKPPSFPDIRNDAALASQHQVPDAPSAKQAAVTYTPASPSQPSKRRGRTWRTVSIVVLLVLVLISGGFYAASTFFLRHSPPTTPTTSVPRSTNVGIAVTQKGQGDLIGISDGSYAFDTSRPDGATKIEASDKLRAGDSKSAILLWQLATRQESNDAEALIYLENQVVIASKHPYITLVIGTYSIGPAASFLHNNLLGAYVAQKEFNDAQKLSGGYLVRLLIANSGSKWVTAVAQQIVQVAQADSTVVGVMGWPFSADTKAATTILTAAHIPMVSANASNDFLTGISKYCFRVVPPDKRQAILGAHYAEQNLHAKRALIFTDPDDLYSSNLAKAFKAQFTSDGNTIAATENFTTGQPAMLAALLQSGLQTNPDVIYFAGYADDVTSLMADLPTTGAAAKIQVIGGEALAGGNYFSTAQVNFTRLHYTVFAYSNQWDALGFSTQKPPFFTEYADAVDPNRQHRNSSDSFAQPTANAMLSYDATLALLTSVQFALNNGTKKPTPDAIQQGLIQITGSHTFQGATGQISFDSNGDPVDKVVLLMSIDTTGGVKITTGEGTLVKKG